MRKIITPKETQNIIHDRYDHAKFQKLFFQSDLKKSLGSGISEYKQFPELAQDLFYSLFKYKGKMHPAENIKKEFHLNRRFIENTMNSSTFKQLRAYSKLNANTSALGATTLSEQILKENSDLFQQLKDQQTLFKKHKKHLKKLANELKQLKNLPNTIQNQKLLTNIKQKVTQALKKQKTLQNQQTQIEKQFDLYTPLNTTCSTIKSQEEFFQNSYGTSSGSFAPVSFKERMAFSKVFVNNSRFRELLKKLGKMKRLAIKKQKTKTKHSIETISDIILSQNIAHLIPSETILLADPDLEILFDKKFVDSQLLTYDHTGQETKAKGPVIACLDISGSMSGDRDEWAKGTALALVEIAHRQNRNAAVILFDTYVQKIFEFKKKEPNYWSKILEMAEYFTGGGTNFDPPVKEAMRFFEEEKNYEKADLVFITDGEGALSEKTKVEFNELKAKNKISVYSIIIDSQYQLIEHTLSRISDQLIPIEKLTDEVAGDLFEAI